MLILGFSLCDTRPIMGHNLEQVFEFFQYFVFWHFYSSLRRSLTNWWQKVYETRRATCEPLWRSDRFAFQNAWHVSKTICYIGKSSRPSWDRWRGRRRKERKMNFPAATLNTECGHTQWTRSWTWTGCIFFIFLLSAAAIKILTAVFIEGNNKFSMLDFTCIMLMAIIWKAPCGWILARNERLTWHVHVTMSGKKSKRKKKLPAFCPSEVQAVQSEAHK